MFFPEKLFEINELPSKGSGIMSEKSYILSGQEDRKIPLKEQLIYTLTEVGLNPIYTIFAMFLTYFYTDIMHVSPASVGVILLISKIFDGITDLIAGTIIDHTHTKWGSARPWVLRMALPLAAAYMLLVLVPNVSNIGKLVYIFVSYNLSVSVIYTMAEGSTNALPAYMTRDNKSRSSAYALRFFVAVVVQTVFALFFMDIIDDLGGGQKGWIRATAIFAVIAAVAYLLIFLGTKEAVKSSDNGEEDVSLLVALKALIKNKYWFIAVGINFTTVLHQIVILTVGVYYAKYILGDVKLAGLLTMYHNVPAMVLMFLLPIFLQKGVSKRTMTIVGSILMLLGSMISIFKADGMAFIIAMGLRGMGFGAAIGCYQGMIADSIEYGEWKTGVRTSAVITSGGGLGQKVGSAIGSAIIGFALSASGYEGSASVQTDSAISMIRFLFIVVPIVVYVATFLLGYFYKLEKQYPEIIKELNERHAQNDSDTRNLLQNEENEDGVESVATDTGEEEEKNDSINDSASSETKQS